MQKAKPDKAYRNTGFLDSPEARPLRLLSEYIEPLHRFRKHQIRDTIVFFGSSRVKAPEESRRQLRAIREKVKRSKRMSARLQAELQCAEVDAQMSQYYDQATELAKRLTEWSMRSYPPYRFVVCSGGGPGIMEAANKGAYLAGGKSIGLNISLPSEQYSNHYVTPDLNFEFHYFFMRKFWFVYLAKALVMFPGGFGTLDELMEVLTLIQTKKTKKQMAVVLYGAEYWNQIINFKAMVAHRVIDKEDLEIFRMVNTTDEAFGYLTHELSRTHPADGPSL
jgi:uncharacterized protein (TIGR00730 family)